MTIKIKKQLKKRRPNRLLPKKRYEIGFLMCRPGIKLEDIHHVIDRFLVEKLTQGERY